ncbi:hypothetical protein pb186bvf_009477 [Paramecium bursaria]
MFQILKILNINRHFKSEKKQINLGIILVIINLYIFVQFPQYSINIEVSHEKLYKLNDFLDKQCELNNQILKELLYNQKNLEYNLCQGLNVMKKSILSINEQFHKSSFVISRRSQTRKQQARAIIDILGQTKWDKELVLEHDLPELFRDRLFEIKVCIVDKNGQICESENSFISLRLFTSEKFPQTVEKNNRGKSIFSGEITQSSFSGKAHFRKISITDVSSHFPQQKFILALVPSNNLIKPLILDNILVKAKKIK